MSHQQILEHGPRFDPEAQSEIRLGLLDVDETLLPQHSQEAPSHRVKIAVQQAAELIPVGLVTARSLPKVSRLLDATHLDGPLILNNGAQVYDARNEKMVVERPLPLSATQNILRTLQKRGLDFSVQDDGIDYWYQADGVTGQYFTKRLLSLPVSAVNMRAVPNFTPDKPFFIAVHDLTTEQIAEFNGVAQQYASQYVDMKTVHEYIQKDGSKTYDIFFADERADKSFAVEVAADIAGLELCNTLFVGDGLNDKGIMEAVGTGVAMGNAAKEVKAVATHIAPDFERNGAAVALEELVIAPKRSHSHRH